MKKSSKTFVPLSPTTYEQNKEELNRLNTEIIEASRQRNYPLAKKLQQDYNYCVQVDHYFKEQKLKQEKDSEISLLKNARLADEEALKQRMKARMRTLLPRYEQRLKEIEQKHRENINQIEHRFSSPRYAYKPSSSLRHMLKVESFYANQRDFDSAEQYRNLITQKAHQEIIESEINNELSFSAAIEAENRRYEIEKKGFHQHLEKEKLKLRTDIEKELIQIKHKYSNITLKSVISIDASNKPSVLPPSPDTSLNATFSSDFSSATDDSSCSSNITGKTKGDDRSVFITTAPDNKQFGGEKNIYQALNDGFSDILQRSEVQDKSNFYPPVVKPSKQRANRNQRTIRKPYSRSPRTARNRRRPVTKIPFSTTY